MAATIQQQPSEQPHQTGFLDLPVEIRLEIYDQLLRTTPYTKCCRPGPDSKVHASLLRTNRQIHDEATDLLYGSNTFLAHPTLLTSFPRLRAWYGPIKESSIIPRIRRFHTQVRLDVDLPYEADAVTEAFSGLDELSIDVVQAMFLGVGYRNLRKFEGVRGVKKVRITGSTTGFEDYVQWLKMAMMSEPDAKIPDFVPQQQAGWVQRLANVHY
ncbi:hypothetical protein LCI18_004407 [Fusarium solani-melongenae]|uniref:Uncharacterized protein n=1 Tax=Fusarium solani subsp. cucurbitae TaxID=2747967 RepID=A0ACD3YX83_FUSSC|nr:hypothetical protein LCI18_004407 [Fusarium solani-melongenae]